MDFVYFGFLFICTYTCRSLTRVLQQGGRAEAIQITGDQRERICDNTERKGESFVLNNNAQGGGDLRQYAGGKRRRGRGKTKDEIREPLTVVRE